VKAEIPYDALPGFPSVAVSGHTGKLLLGHLGTTPLLVLSGRPHFYEGHSMEAITFPIRVLAEFGIRDVLLTNAAGGINRRFRPGDFMYLTDHINAMPENPLRGELAPGQTRFVDLSQTYDQALNALLKKAAKRTSAPLHGGVYVAVAGPCYETPAEIRALARLGADAIGMSTVPEAIVARQCGLSVAALSCITNLAAGCSQGPLSHAEVLATGERVNQTAMELLRSFAGLYAQHR
jgi:purine-nucleoside phosphorylase